VTIITVHNTVTQRQFQNISLPPEQHHISDVAKFTKGGDLKKEIPQLIPSNVPHLHSAESTLFVHWQICALTAAETTLLHIIYVILYELIFAPTCGNSTDWNHVEINKEKQRLLNQDSSDIEINIEMNIQWVRNLCCQSKVSHNSYCTTICFLDQNILHTQVK